MTLTQIADIADLLAAFGIIVTLLFLVFELRQNARQGSYANWQGIMGFVKSHREWSSNPDMADIVARGRMDFDALTASEQYAFENWMMNGLTAFYIMLVHEPRAVAERGGRETSIKQIQHIMSFPGTIECWSRSGLERRYPPELTAVVRDAINTYQEEHHA